MARAILVAWLSLGSWSLCTTSAQAQAQAPDTLPTDVAQSISAVVQKLGTLRGDRVKLNAAIKQLDADVGPLRVKDDYAKSTAAELTKWLTDLSDAKKEAVRADAVFKDLFAATDRIRDGNDFTRATRLSDNCRRR